MKSTKLSKIFTINLSILFLFLVLAVTGVSAQDTGKVALQRGYRTGYSDGYMSGYRDAIENTSKNFKRHKDYETADRAYSKDFGLLEDYRDGYQQGFEVGYEAGFDKRSFDAVLPSQLNRRGVVKVDRNMAQVVEPTAPAVDETQTAPAAPISEPAVTPVAEPMQTITPEKEAPISPAVYVAPSQNGGEGVIVVPKDSELLVEVLNELTTDNSKVGDVFQARVVSPNELNGAIIEGKVAKIQRPGRIKRRAEMILSFDRIVLNDRRWGNYNAILAEVMPIKGDNIKRVDVEGSVEGKSSLKSDLTKVGIATGSGLVIGAVAGGPVGAVVGAGVGAGIGVGAAVIERGKNIRIQRNQQLRIKTSYETQIR